MKAKRFILMLLVMLGSVTGAWADMMASVNDLQAKISYESDISRLFITAWSERGDEISLMRGNVIIKKGSTTIGTFRMSYATGGYEVKNINLNPGNYTITFPEETFQALHENEKGMLIQLIYPEKTFSFSCCDHSYSTTGICSKCKRFQKPDNSDGKYHIKNYGNLKWYAEYRDAPAILDNDIVINTGILNSDGTLKTTTGKTQWTPFDTSYDFDGNNHSISGILVINNSDTYVGGLFKKATSNITIKNLTIKDSYVEGKGVAAHVGCFIGEATNREVVIENCCNQATVVSTSCAAGFVYCITDTKLISCLNMGKINGYHSTSEDFGTQDLYNCVALEGCANSNFKEGMQYVSSTEIKNGLATFLLNNGVTDGTQAWYQKLGTDDMPRLGTTGGDIVYGGFTHGSTTAVMSNTSPTARYHLSRFNSTAITEEKGGHGYSMVDGVCQVCGLSCSHPSYTDGVCNTCQYHCPHSPHKTDNGFSDYCTICHMDMSEIYEPALLNTVDAYYEVSNGGQLYWVAQQITKNGGLKFRLMNDITVNQNVLTESGSLRTADIRRWTFKLDFRGIFDGNGHSISGLYGASMFYYMYDATVKNVGFIDSYFEKATLVEEENSHCTISRCYSVATVEGTAGMISGLTYDSTIEDCHYAGHGSAQAFCEVIKIVNINRCFTTCENIYMKNYDSQLGSYNIAGITRSRLANGSIAYDMNANAQHQVWYQRIGIDEYPVLISTGNNTVYRLTNCQNAIVYENVNTLDDGNHYYDQDTRFCKYCKNGEPAVLATDGFYEVLSIGNLYWVSHLVEDKSKINIRLMKDITDNTNPETYSARWWYGLGGDDVTFEGVFDGQGHVIRGLRGYSLFNKLEKAKIYNVGIENSILTRGAISNGVKRGSQIVGCFAKNVKSDIEKPQAMLTGLIDDNCIIDGCYVYNSEYSVMVMGSMGTSVQIKNCVVLLSNNSAILILENEDGPIPENCKALSTEQFASGEAAWTLNGGKTDGTQPWYQQLGNDEMPTHTKTDGNTVYGFTNCKGNFVCENKPDFEGHIVVDNGTSLTCKYCGEIMSGEVDTNDYLVFTAVGGSVTIGMMKTGTPVDYVLQFSKSKSIWTKLTLSDTNDNIITLEEGETCYLRHGTAQTIGKISSNADNYWTVTMTGTGTVEAGGNTMSLLDATTQKTDLSSFAFVNLFKGCYKMTKAPKLPATSINERCYMGMFEGTNITEAPELPAASVIKGSYQNMFKNCLNLETAPDLLATRVNWAGYQEMFYGCKKITEVTLGNITVIENANAFSYWLDGTAEGTTGVANMPDALVGNVSLPSNWTAHSIDGHNFIPEKDAEDNDIWVWDGVTKATLKLVCTKNAKHKSEAVATGDAIISAITTAPTCTVDGVRTYTATVIVEGIEYQGTKDVAEPMLGHDYQYGVCSRCGDSPSHFDSFTINDGDPYILPHDCSIATLTYSRYYPENIWSAWCTPFDVNASYLKDNGLTPAYIEGIHNYDDNEDGTIDRTVMEIVKISNGRLRAGTPLLVRAAEGYSTQLELSDVTMKASDDLNNIHTETATSIFDFIGTYAGTTAAAADNIYSLNNSGAMVHRTGTILPLRWYCQIEQKPSFIGEETPAPALARAIYIRVIGEEDQETGIRTLYDEADQTLERADGIFDLSGRKLSAPQHGKINIINGKKQFVK